ncbi:MAG: Fic family protein [Lachnospiraceae bacterium]|nr:Fic family protein [Lachnospiraceae bacterium]
MRYMSVTEIAEKWGLSVRSVREYCAQGRIEGAFLTGRTWNIPADAMKPDRKPKASTKKIALIDVLKRERESKLSGGIYHKVQIDLTYNSNHMEGSRLTHDQTRHIFETSTIGISDEVINVDDIVETANHFRCIDLIIEEANYLLSERLIKQLHGILKNGTSDSRKAWFAVGDYKQLPNEVGGLETTAPEEVPKEIKALLKAYNEHPEKTLDEILDFHVKFEKIHPFQDGNGRVGRLLMFKECLRNNITPFIITEPLKLYYYRGLHEWNSEKGFLRDTCLTAQDQFKAVLDYFKIGYED